MQKLFTLIVLLAISLSSFAANITGTVKDAGDGSPLTGVIINIKNTSIATQTDADGNFEFTGLNDGKYELVFAFVTYKKYTAAVTIAGGADVVLDIKLKSENRELKGVSVSGNRVTHTENAVMMEMKKSSLVVSGISAAQIGKTMDRNAADVVKRIPGVTVSDDRFIVVRGLFDRYNTVWLNDAIAPSSEVDKRSFSFDLIPSGLIDRIMVYKTPAPDLPGDFAGGMIKIYTTSLADKTQYGLSLQSSYRQYSTGTNFSYEQPSSTDWLGYDDGKRSIPAGTPTFVNTSDPNIADITKAFPNDYLLKTKSQSPDYRLNGSASNVWKLKKLKIGNTFGLSYSNISTNYSIDRQSWTDTSSRDFHYIDRQAENKNSVGILDNAAVSWGNNKIEFKNLYNQIGKSTVTLRNTAPLDWRDTLHPRGIEKSYLIGYESRATYNAQFTGTHKSKNDNRKYMWTIGYTDLFKNQPDLRRLKYTKQIGEVDSLFNASIAATADPVYGGRYYARLSEHTYNFNHQYTQKVRVRKYSFEVNVGNNIEYKKRNFNSRLLGYTIKTIGNPNSLHLNRLPIQEIFADSNLGDKKFKMAESTDGTYNYSAHNKLIASFVSVKLPIGKHISILGGVRNEYNIMNLQGYTTSGSISPEVTTNYYLPSVNVTYNFRDNMLVRAAYGKTLNRPEFREWSPLSFYDFDNKALIYGSLYAVPGDTLKVAKVQNFDLRWEWYPSTGEMVHFGGYYKSFKDPIQQVIVGGNASADSRSYTFTNANKATCMGLELDARKNLMFLDDAFKTNFFKDFSLVANAALIKSSLTLGNSSVLTSQIPNTPLQGQSPYMINAGLFYQNDTLGIQASVLYNVFGQRIYLLGDTVVPSIGELPFRSLDAVVSKTFYKLVTINFGVQNLLNSSITRIQDFNMNNKFENNPMSGDRQVFTYKPGRYYTLGIKFRLSR